MLLAFPFLTPQYKVDNKIQYKIESYMEDDDMISKNTNAANKMNRMVDFPKYITGKPEPRSSIS